MGLFFNPPPPMGPPSAYKFCNTVRDNFFPLRARASSNRLR
jgi:hypothetical protein